ncbi:20171_t:CDS:2, partial [Gigaspora rosea]
FDCSTLIRLGKKESKSVWGEDGIGGFLTEVALFWNWDMISAKLREVLSFVDLVKEGFPVPETNLSFPVMVLAKQNAMNKKDIFMKLRIEQRSSLSNEGQNQFWDRSINSDDQFGNKQVA